MNKIGIALLFAALPLASAYSQNLVKNPSFEEFKGKNMGKLRDINDLKYCGNPNAASPNVYCRHSIEAAWSSPKNVFGFQYPHSGELYAGLVIFNAPKSSHCNNFREYIRMELAEGLLPGQLYCVGMYASLGNKCHYASDGIGVLLSAEKVGSPYQGLLTGLQAGFTNRPAVPSIYCLPKQIVADTMAWVKLCDTVRAKGGERYLTIGNFRLDKDTKSLRVSKKPDRTDADRYAYYYIDDVWVEPSSGCGCGPALEAGPPAPSIAPNVPMVMEQLYFETGRYEILPASFHYLDSLCAGLPRAGAAIEISGHTDSAGDEALNQPLSQNRASAVRSYLISKGLPAELISAQGFGSARPIAPNDTEAGRAKNRRVELVLRLR